MKSSRRRQPNAWPSALDLFNEEMDTTFDRFGDESNRPRLVHAYGALAKVVWAVQPDAAALGYTGVYASGSTAAIIRLSLAGKPGSFSPGFAVKFLIDGQTSANIIGMFSLDGQGTTDFDYFRNQLKTTVPLPANAASSFITQRGLTEFETGSTPATNLMPDQPALFSTAGALQTKPAYPTLLYLAPNPALTASWDNFTGDFRDGLATTPVGTLLYTVYAATGGCQCAGGTCADALANADACAPKSIATITTASAFVSSKYGDGGIFFRHSRWFKKSRSTCVFATNQGDASIDSTVLPTYAGNTATCVADAACAAASLVSATSGCTQEDAYLLGASAAPAPLGAIVGGVVGGAVVLAVVVIVLVRRHRRIRSEAALVQGSFKGLVESPNVESPGPGGYRVPVAAPGVAIVVSSSPPPPQQQPPPQQLVDQLVAFYRVHDARKTPADAAKVVAHFMAPGGGGVHKLNTKLREKYGVGLQPEHVAF